MKPWDGAAFLHELGAVSQSGARVDLRLQQFEALPKGLRAAGGWIGRLLSEQRSLLARGCDAPVGGDWLAILAEVQAHFHPSGSSYDLPLEAHPFAEELSPFLGVFRTRVLGSVDPGDAALAGLEKALARRLGEIATPPYYAAFEAEREGSAAGSFARFEERYWSTSGDSVFANFPIAARRMAQVTSDSANAAIELFAHWKQEQTAVSMLSGAPIAAPITKLDAALSDPHNKGRSVAIISMGERRVVYKPKPLGLDVAYRNFILAIEQFEGGHRLGLRSPACIDCGDHGWAEYVEAIPCASVSELVLYYEHFGSLAAVMHLLAASDLHYENVIAHRQSPVPVDLETLIYPRRPRFDPLGGSLLGLDSVLDTGLLPMSVSLKDGASEVSAALAERVVGRFPMAVFDSPRSSEMRLVGMCGDFRPRNHRPEGHDLTLSHADRKAAMVHGVDSGLRLLEQNKAHLPGLLEPFGSHFVRFVPRPTQVYARVLQRLARPVASADGAVAELETNFLLLPLVANDAEISDELPAEAPALEAERQDLLRGDIPVFHAHAKGKDLLHQGKVVGVDVFAQSGWERVEKRVEALNPEMRAYQARVTAAAMDLNAPPSHFARPVGSARDAARAIAEEILTAGVTSSTGRKVWISLGAPDRSDTISLVETDGSIYQGTTGIALFFAALSSVAKDAWFGRLAEELFDDGLGQFLHNPAEASPLGIAGYGGFAWGASVMDRLIGGERAPTVVATICDRLTPELIVGHAGLDIMDGAAGLLLCLCPSELAAIPSIRDACVTALVKRQQPPSSGGGWITLRGEPPLAGFAHGAAGVIAALNAAQTAGSNIRGIDRAIQSGAELLRRAKLPEGRWQDNRKGAYSPGESWCHGASGILLAGLEMPSHPFASSMLPARDYLVAQNGPGGDCLCCGKAGALDILLEVGRSAKDLGAIARANAGLDDLGQRYLRTGHLTLGGGARRPEIFPTLFQGAAGVGYTLLRRDHADIVPSLLRPRSSG